MADWTYWGDKYHAIPYTVGIVERRFHEVLDTDNPHVCPHCHGNNARLMRDGSDLYCFTCGWRDAEYFNRMLARLIKWVAQQEKRWGGPVLLSDDEVAALQQQSEARKRKRLLDAEYRERDKERSKRYAEANAERLREYRRRYRREHNEERVSYNREWKARHPGHQQRYDRMRYITRREANGYLPSVSQVQIQQGGTSVVGANEMPTVWI